LAGVCGTDLSALSDPRTESTFQAPRRICSACTGRDTGRRALRESIAPLISVASFCPCADVLADLMHRLPSHRPGPARAA